MQNWLQLYVIVNVEIHFPIVIYLHSNEIRMNEGEIFRFKNIFLNVTFALVIGEKGSNEC